MPGAAICPACGLEVPPEATFCPRDGTQMNDEEGREPTIRRDSLAGITIGEYVIKNRVGAGGMGIVYEGVQPLINKAVAIKVLRHEFAEDPVQVQRLLAEARAVNAIRHRGIIDIFGFGELPDGRQYIVMEYLSGKPLDAVLEERGSLPAIEALPILEEILSALGGAHGAGVIHRDLKPSNIFLVAQPDGTRYTKLLDFGLAKNTAEKSANTRITQIVGTPEYMAPEQARGEKLGPWTDLYALGVVAFEMLTGRIPFEGPTALDVAMKHVEQPPPVPSSIDRSIPIELDKLILRLMSKEPGQRPGSADAVRMEVKRITRNLQAAATRITSDAVQVVRPPAPPASRSPTDKLEPVSPSDGTEPPLGPEPISASGKARAALGPEPVSSGGRPRPAPALGPEPKSKAALGPEPKSRAGLGPEPKSKVGLGPEPKSNGKQFRDTLPTDAMTDKVKPLPGHEGTRITAVGSTNSLEREAKSRTDRFQSLPASKAPRSRLLPVVAGIVVALAILGAFWKLWPSDSESPPVAEPMGAPPQAVVPMVPPRPPAAPTPAPPVPSQAPAQGAKAQPPQAPPAPEQKPSPPPAKEAPVVAKEQPAPKPPPVVEAKAEHSEPAHASRKAERSHPAPPQVTRPALLNRIDQLESSLEKSSNEDDAKETALLLLKKQHDKAVSAKDPAELRAIAEYLELWQHKFLRHH